MGLGLSDVVSVGVRSVHIGSDSRSESAKSERARTLLAPVETVADGGGAAAGRGRLEWTGAAAERHGPEPAEAAQIRRRQTHAAYVHTHTQMLLHV